MDVIITTNTFAVISTAAAAYLFVDSFWKKLPSWSHEIWFLCWFVVVRTKSLHCTNSCQGWAEVMQLSSMFCTRIAHYWLCIVEFIVIFGKIFCKNLQFISPLHNTFSKQFVLFLSDWSWY